VAQRAELQALSTWQSGNVSEPTFEIEGVRHQGIIGIASYQGSDYTQATAR
jgi:hypothetical protein